MENQKPRVNILVIIAIAIGMPAVVLGTLYAIRPLWTNHSPTAPINISASSQNDSVPSPKPAGLLAGFFSEIEPSAQPARSTYDNTPDPVNITAEEFDSALQTCKDHLLFLENPYRNKVDTEWDGFLLPNSSYGKVDVQWKQVFDSDGKPIMRPAGGSDKQLGVFGPGCYRLHLVDKAAAPAYAVGQMTITVPLTWEHVSFSKDDVGQFRQMGTLSAVLKQCQNDYYCIEITGNLAGRKIVDYAEDATGGRLERSSWQRRLNTISAKVKGRVARVELFVSRAQHSAKADVIARAQPDTSELRRQGDPAIAHPRYVRKGMTWDFKTITEPQLVSAVRVLADRCDAMVGYNNPVVRVCLPPAANSWFATINFGKEESCKRILRDSNDKPVPCDVEHGLFGDDGGGIGDEIRFISPKYPAKDAKPPAFHRAKGTVRIRYPAEVRRVVLTREKPESGSLRADFRGCKVMVHGWAVPGDTSFTDTDHAAMRVYDATGHRLKALGYFDSRYWGTPARVELVDVTKWIDVTIPYDLAPAPLLPPWGS